MTGATDTAWIARLEARPGCEEAVEKLIADVAANVAVASDGCWWALRLGAGEHLLFTTLGADAFTGFEDQNALLDGDVTVEEVAVLACKLQPLRIATAAVALRMSVRSASADDAVELLTAARPIVERELETVAWFALRFRDGDLGVVAAFPDRHARRAHLAGRFARDVGRKVFGMLDAFPAVDSGDVIEQRRPTRR